jgi:hypothetical protein
MFRDIKQFVETQLDSEYIPVESLSDANKCAVLGLVIKSKKWPWERPHYEPCRYQLGDILREKLLDTPDTERVLLTPKMSYSVTEENTGNADLNGRVMESQISNEGNHSVETDFGRIVRTHLKKITTLDEIEHM